MHCGIRRTKQIVDLIIPLLQNGSIMVHTDQLVVALRLHVTLAVLVAEIDLHVVSRGIDIRFSHRDGEHTVAGFRVIKPVHIQETAAVK